jgi:hypothetical protein
MRNYVIALFNMSTFEWNYGYDTEKNNYPLEQLKADIERMVNTDKEFIEAINTLKREMEEEYYQNNEARGGGRK